MAENEINEGSDEVRISDRTERTSKHTADEAISDSKRAERYEKRFTTFSDNDDDQSFKAIQPAVDSFGIDFGDGTIETSKGKVDKGQEALATAQALKPSSPDSIPPGGQNYRPDQVIAANVTPSNPVVSDATLPGSDEVKDLELPENAVAQYQDTRNWHLQRDIVRSIQAPDIAHPLAGQELSIINKIPDDSWNSASSMFYEFTQNGFSNQQFQILLKAILANEIHHYDRFDQADDVSARLTGSPVLPGKYRAANDVTCGLSQISVNGVKKLSEEFPPLKEYLTKNGYPPGKELQALLDPNMAPILIAGNVAHNARMYERHGIPVNQETLSYGYNPDVSFRKDDLQHQNPLTNNEAKDLKKNGVPIDKALLPSKVVLEKSEHVENVKNWFGWLNKSGTE